jgi:hypothetical protein
MALVIDEDIAEAIGIVADQVAGAGGRVNTSYGQFWFTLSRIEKQTCYCLYYWK